MSETRTGYFLVVCSANQCRSPLAAAILHSACAARGLDVAVESAGIAAVPGVPATFPTLEAAGAMGLDISEHRSRDLTAGMIRRADLVLAMERRHLQEVVVTEPAAFARTFTLKELVRRGTEAGPRAPDETFADWLARVHKGRRPSDVVGLSVDDDVLDPTGNPLADHRSTADEIQGLVDALLELLLPVDEPVAER